MSEILPTLRNLLKRRITDDGLCPVSKQHEETSCHILWTCATARDVWTCPTSLLQKRKCIDRGFFNVWEEMISKLQKAKIEEIACICRTLWMRRNKEVFEGRFESPRSLLQVARVDLENSQQAQVSNIIQAEGNFQN